MNRQETNHPQESGTSTQKIIEKAMQSYTAEERWESIYLFSSEGLLMASYGSSNSYHEEKLLEFSFSLIGTVQMLEKNIPIKEIIIKGKEKKWLVFEYLQAWGENMILSAVVSGKKGYRRAIKKVIRQIQNLN
jgi:metal-responsive CopG/Arc/MetJ family transcriptional regulator